MVHAYPYRVSIINYIWSRSEIRTVNTLYTASQSTNLDKISIDRVRVTPACRSIVTYIELPAAGTESISSVPSLDLEHVRMVAATMHIMHAQPAYAC